MMRNDDVNFVWRFPRQIARIRGAVLYQMNGESPVMIYNERDGIRAALRRRKPTRGNLSICRRVRVYVAWKTSVSWIIGQLLLGHETKCTANGGGCETSRATVQYHRQAKIAHGSASIHFNNDAGPFQVSVYNRRNLFVEISEPAHIFALSTL
jgi:hypothetical protein